MPSPNRYAMALCLPLAMTACSSAAPAAANQPLDAAQPSVDVAVQPAEHTAGATRIVAVGDLHGDLDNAVAVLQLAGVVDDHARWIGGSTVLVQTGDTTDRGPDSKAIMDLLLRLGGEAKASGGRVVALLGNHEVMNLQGDWRYVTDGDITAFGGRSARETAFAPQGEYGRWLRGLPVVAIEGDTVFVHGGVHPNFANKGLETINADAARALSSTTLTSVQYPVLGPTGPLWFRGYVQDEEATVCPTLRDALKALGKARMVVGHTTRRDGRIQSRCGGRLQVIDIGIADAYGGHLGAWQWIDGDATAIYPDKTVDLEDPA